MAWFKLPEGVDTVSASGLKNRFEKVIDDVKRVFVEIEDHLAADFGKAVPNATPSSPPDEVVEVTATEGEDGETTAEATTTDAPDASAEGADTGTGDPEPGADPDAPKPAA